MSAQMSKPARPVVVGDPVEVKRAIMWTGRHVEHRWEGGYVVERIDHDLINVRDVAGDRSLNYPRDCVRHAP